METITQVLRNAQAALGEEGRIDAEILLAQVLAQPRSWLYAHAEDQLNEALHQRFLDLIKRRQTGQPLAHIVGQSEFWSLTLLVTADTLIPRPETELLVELALARLPEAKASRVLDLGTGTGAITLAIAHERAEVEMTAVDACDKALKVARENGQRLGLTRVRFLHSDWFSAVTGNRFDLIVSNPPYIADDDRHLNDLRFEPLTALASGADGLEAMRIIVRETPNHLLPGGWLLVEHGWQQGAAVRDLFKQAGFIGIETVQDLEHRERVTFGQLL